MSAGATLRRALGILRCEQYGDHHFEIFDGCRRRLGSRMEQRNTERGRVSNPAATFPLLLLILIDSMGFGILTPLLASALAPESESAI